MPDPTSNHPAPVQRRRCRAAFTLVELLVAVAVLAVLAALLLPALGSGQSKAHRAQCLSQLHQWGIAVQLYADEHEDEIPRRGQGVRPLTQLNRPEDWFNALAGELGLPGFGAYIAGAGTNANSPPALFVCPAAKPAPARYFLAYAMNMYLSPWNLPAPHHTIDIPAPALTVFLGDGGVGYCSAFPAAAEYSPQARHRQTANLAFLDGHADNFRGEEIGSNTGITQRPDVIWRFDTNSPPFAP